MCMCVWGCWAAPACKNEREGGRGYTLSAPPSNSMTLMRSGIKSILSNPCRPCRTSSRTSARPSPPSTGRSADLTLAPASHTSLAWRTSRCPPIRSTLQSGTRHAAQPASPASPATSLPWLLIPVCGVSNPLQPGTGPNSLASTLQCSRVALCPLTQFPQSPLFIQLPQFTCPRCEADPRFLGTSSIDTTCTIWNIETGVVDTQLIAHDKEVRYIRNLYNS